MIDIAIVFQTWGNVPFLQKNGLGLMVKLLVVL